MSAERPERETKLIIEAGEIIQYLTATRLATLAVLGDGHDTQIEMAEELGCSSSLISKHLTTLSNLPTPIVNKPDNTLTTVGSEIYGEIDSLLHRLGVSLASIDWQEDAELAEVERCLDPLPAARGPLSFLVFHSIGVNNSVGEQIDLLKQEPVKLSTIISDVRTRQDQRGETVERKHVRQQVTKLAEAGSIIFEDATVTLTDKGEAQERFIEQVIKSVGNTRGDDPPVWEPSSAKDQLIASPPTQNSGIPLTVDTASDKMAIVPEYQLGNKSVLTLSNTVTVGEFVEEAVRLREEYDEDTPLDLTWMIQPQTEDVSLMFGELDNKGR
ncbi:hypothetical protein [Halocatena halophila]|uniref:hypothetical protein n=1 Tax=Halocatena halophila TaxID=2814576 RepID=UPI002ED018C3